MTRRTTIAALGALALAAGAAAPGSAQTGFLPWVGCWQAEGAPAEEAALCVRPADDPASVEILRVEEGGITAREVLWADGERHETVREECTGWESGTFSADGRRIFLRSRHECDDGAVRTGSGVMALADGAWLDVRALELGDEPTAWVQRYTRVSGDAEDLTGVSTYLAERATTVRAARAVASASLDLDDVLEAAEILPAEAVEAWLAETGDPFEIDGRALLALDDAGVPDRVIDVVVALSNPNTFRLADGGAVRVPGEDGRRARGAYGSAWGGSLFWDPFGYRRYRYSPYSYGYGYGGYGYYGYGYNYRPTVVVIEPRQPDAGGRVINGRGYTRRSGGGSNPRPASSPSMGRSSSGSSSASPSRGSTSRSGGTARKAKPRGGKKSGGGGF